MRDRFAEKLAQRDANDTRYKPTGRPSPRAYEPPLTDEQTWLALKKINDGLRVASKLGDDVEIPKEVE